MWRAKATTTAGLLAPAQPGVFITPPDRTLDAAPRVGNVGFLPRWHRYGNGRSTDSTLRIPTKRQSTVKSWYATEDGLAVWLGLIVVALALPAAAGVDLLGWLAATHVWLEPAKAVRPVAKAYANVPGILSLLATFAFVLVLVSLGAFWLGVALKKFVPAFTVIYWISILCWLIGHYAYIAQTPDKRGAMGITWSLGLTGEAGFIVALARRAGDRELLAGFRDGAQRRGSA